MSRLCDYTIPNNKRELKRQDCPNQVPALLYHTKQQKGTKTLVIYKYLYLVLYHTKQQKGTKTSLILYLQHY